MDIKKIKKEPDDYKNKYLRVLADYQNLERRIETEKAETVKNANTNLILKLLPFLDNLNKAEIFVKDEGLKIAKENFEKTLKETGLEEIKVLGRDFDPLVAEAIDVVPGVKDNLVVEVLKKGYRFNNKVIRVAQVKVSQKKIEKETEKAKPELLKSDYM